MSKKSKKSKLTESFLRDLAGIDDLPEEEKERRLANLQDSLDQGPSFRDIPNVSAYVSASAMSWLPPTIGSAFAIVANELAAERLKPREQTAAVLILRTFFHAAATQADIDRGSGQDPLSWGRVLAELIDLMNSDPKRAGDKS